MVVVVCTLFARNGNLAKSTWQGMHLKIYLAIRKNEISEHE
jgi:hypothetical protein